MGFGVKYGAQMNRRSQQDCGTNQEGDGNAVLQMEGLYEMG